MEDLKATFPHSQRESYYTLESLDKQAQEFADYLTEFRHRRSLKIHPSKSALLVLDMQKYFFDPDSHAFIPSGPAILHKIKALKNLFHRLQLPVIQTCHLDRDEDSSMLRWWRGRISPDDPTSQIIDEFIEDQSFFMAKSQYDAFYETALDSFLQKNEISQVVISGVMTHLCCETTARSAFVRGYEVFFTIDGTATYNKNYHLSSLLNLAHGFSLPVLTEEIISRLEVHHE